MQQRSSSERLVLPDPWIPVDPGDKIASVFALSSLGTGTLVSTNNDAHYVPVIFPCDATLYALRFAGANATGNYDCGLYDASLNRLASTGSTALSSGVQTLSLPNLRVRAGELYYCALAMSSTSGQVFRPNYSVSQMRGFGIGREASALPLPSTASPVSPVNSVIPIFAFGVR